MMANERLRRRYEVLASTDELTKLANRRSFLEQAQRMAIRATRNRSPTCVLMIDLDRFSNVNRQFGHTCGDGALVAFAQFARRQLRPGDLIGRYGSKEFCVVLDATAEPQAVLIAERLRAGIAD
jgi:diguanylate cyclase (GGDEF)-like protein